MTFLLFLEVMTTSACQKHMLQTGIAFCQADNPPATTINAKNVGGKHHAFADFVCGRTWQIAREAIVQ